jgi:hypothetical protein
VSLIAFRVFAGNAASPPTCPVGDDSRIEQGHCSPRVCPYTARCETCFFRFFSSFGVPHCRYRCAILTTSILERRNISLSVVTLVLYTSVPSVTYQWALVAERGEWRSRLQNTGRESKSNDLSKTPSGNIRSEDACNDGPGVRRHLACPKSGVAASNRRFT